MYAKGFYGTDNDGIRGSRGVKPTTSTSLSFYDFCCRLLTDLNKFFSYALYLGMTPEQYWDGELELFDAYIEKSKLEQQQRNREFHLQGQYFVLAIKEALKQNVGDSIYPTEPFELKFAGEPEKTEQEKIEDQMKAMFSSIKNQQRG